MANRLPCSGTLTGGIPDIVTDGKTSYLLPPNRPEIPADCILRLVSNPDLMRQMGDRGYQQAIQRFTWGKVVERMCPHLERLTR